MNSFEDIKTEFIRKGIHFCSLSIPVVYYFVSKQTALTVLIPITAAVIIVDVARNFHQPTAQLFYRIFGILLRRHEYGDQMKTLNGATYMLISATLCVLIFPKFLVITSFAVLILADASAALVGRSFGKHKLVWKATSHKTLEGSTAFFIAAIIAILLTPKLEGIPGEYLIGIAGAIVGTIAEIVSFGVIDDNIAIPFSVSGIMWALYAIAYPNINIYKLDALV
jgi:dolichol kinase